jgi:hypothetical protein
MRKIIKIIEKSEHIKKRFLDKVKSKIKMIQNKKDKHEGHNHNDDDDDDDELDNHNDSCNWSYA